MSYNILQIIPELDIGGAERTAIEVAEAIINDGGKAFVLSNGGILEGELKKCGATFIKADVKTKNPFKILFSNVALIKKIIAENNINIVHARSRAPAVSAYMAAKAMGVHFITTYHGIYNAKSAAKRWYNSFMARGELVIANSEYTKTHIIKQHNLNPEKIRVVYRGVDLEKFDPEKITTAAQDALLNNWVLGGRTLPKIILPARLTAWKGQKVLIEAANILKSQNIIADYIFVGSSQGRDEYVVALKSLIQSYGLEDNFHFVGQCNDMPTAFMLADIVVTPSTEPEAFGRTAAEAQAMAKPIIASRLGGAMETVVDNETGFLIETGNATQLAQKISHILTMPPQEIANLTKLAQKRVKSLFSAAQLQEKTLGVYKEIMK
jgi:glycosyltransferase involved in cell wall biosynthesis